ncbi:MAG: hypothetical protein IJU40_05035 [Desulfovibrionaceae bacterium]|nr:hypothetical protein [Desulfovibrionaceae bacterium]
MPNDQILFSILNSLKNFSPNKLIEIIESEAKRSPEFFEYLKKITHKDNDSSKDDKLLDQIDLYISSEISIIDEHEYKEVVDTCSKIINNLKELLDSGQFDKIISITEDVITFFESCIENEDEYSAENSGRYYNYDMEESFTEIADIVINNSNIFIKALKQSSLNETEKILAAINYDYIIQWNTFDKYLQEEHPKEVWDQVATELINIFNDDLQRDDFYVEKDSLIKYAIKALENSDRKNDIITLCEDAVKTFDEDGYIRLIKYLLNFEDYDKAEEYLQKALSHPHLNPDFISELRDFWLQIKETQNNWVAVTILQVEKFCNQHPNVDSYLAIKKAAEKISLLTPLQPTILNYLETGTYPWKQAEWPKELSDPKIQPFIWSQDSYSFPDMLTLLDIALKDKNYESIIYWYDKIKDDKKYYIYGYDRSVDVAYALAEFAPERSIAMFKHLAEKEIQTTKTHNYPTAIKYLKEIKDIMLKNQQDSNWTDYLNLIMTTHKRKSSFMSLLKYL